MSRSPESAVLVKKAWGVLALALVFAVSGVLFFLLRPVSGDFTYETPSPDRSVTSDEEVRRKYITGPDVETFDTFVYRADTETLEVRGFCQDTYAAILMYPVDVDYRESPLDFKYNIAEPCKQGQEYLRVIRLRDLPLAEGATYYIIRAQQGAKGQWYNPE